MMPDEEWSKPYQAPAFAPPSSPEVTPVGFSRARPEDYWLSLIGQPFLFRLLNFVAFLLSSALDVGVLFLPWFLHISDDLKWWLVLFAGYGVWDNCVRFCATFSYETPRKLVYAIVRRGAKTAIGLTSVLGMAFALQHQRVVDMEWIYLSLVFLFFIICHVASVVFHLCSDKWLNEWQITREVEDPLWPDVATLRRPPV